jgi:hypothetical protein
MEWQGRKIKFSSNNSHKAQSTKHKAQSGYTIHKQQNDKNFNFHCRRTDSC